MAKGRVGRWGVLAVAMVLGVAACGGDYGGLSGGLSGTPSSGTGGGGDAGAHFAAVQPQLDFCRTCHIPEGIGDVENGRDFMLSTDRSRDLADLEASWTRLGGNTPVSRILTMASGQETPHSGGAPWPLASVPYQNMERLLQCFEHPSSCGAQASAAPVEVTAHPLLGEGHRGGHAWSRFCDGEADDALLPVDPVTLIRPGVNAGRAVYFNAYHKNCHVDAAPEDAAPQTCGEWRARIDRGGVLIKGNGAVGAGNFLGGNHSQVLGLPFSTDRYNTLWRSWGLRERPEHFDALVAQRWGTALPHARNPYPLPGEDPNLTDGGSGQLPAALTQLRNPDGSWTGKLSGTCHLCHTGQVGEPDEAGLPGALYGTNSLSDLGVIGRDLTAMGSLLGPVLPALNKVRGTGNITNFQVFLLLKPTVPQLLSWIPTNLSASTGTEDPPVWWNYGHRPLKFFDGGMSADAQRIAISAYDPLLAMDPIPANLAGTKAWIEAHDQDAVAWLLSQRSPAWPEEIDVALAEQGAILFHAKDLFALPANAGLQRPRGGNGSCASCHGAYSPRFVNDPAYLESPELEGIAGYIVPRDLIGTDPRRVDGNTQTVSSSFEDSWYGYPEQRGTENDCGDQNLDRIRGDRENGYLAPPLYGVWATAPYFHNGSVPNVWEVLKSSERTPIWRRVSAPNDTGLDVVMGFDTRFERAYDRERLGWHYEEVPCGLGGALPFVECSAGDPAANPLLERLLSALYANGGLLWNVPNVLALPLGNAEIESRKIYNTRLYSQDNGGHTFTDALTDAERRAIIEYLKTL